MRFVKGKGKDKDSDKKSVSSFGSRSSLAMSTSQLNNAGKEDIIGCFDFVCIHWSGLSRSSSPMSLSKAPLRLLQSSSNLHVDESSQSISSYKMDTSDSTVTKLHSAAWRGDLEKLKKHLKKNSDINCVDSQGRSALHLAAAGGHLNTLYHIVANAGNINAQDNDGATPLNKAIEGGHIEAVQFLLDRGASTDVPDGTGNTSVHVAVKHGVKDALAVLLRKGANPDIINYDGEAPLHIAAINADQQVCQNRFTLILCQYMQCLDILLRCGALVNISSHQLVTPLMLAAKSGKTDVVTSLLEFDAKVEDKDVTGNTAAHYANGKKRVG